ncbi:hypothetical protein E2C01_049813 [Portunus trituberculatus]|uniref:Uncharacterized protein n=1 Tax=Portunus trituberculatus TaxID=210409 RepID=A0A5B7GFC1_PORTR|nr:hypothetical protein [Portunus trituberculatus]
MVVSSLTPPDSHTVTMGGAQVTKGKASLSLHNATDHQHKRNKSQLNTRKTTTALASG